MAKNVVKHDNIVDKKESTVPVEPSLRQFDVYGITPPSEFALYGKGDKLLYEAEIDRVANQLRQEVFYSNNTEEVAGGEEDKKVGVAKTAKKANFSAIIIFIFGLLIAALLVVGKYVTPIASMPSLLLLTDKAGLDYVFDFINFFLKDIGTMDIVFALQCVVVGISLVTVVTIIVSIFSMAQLGVNKALKIITVLQFVCVVAFAAIIFADKGKIAIGYYILFGLSFLSMVIALVSKGRVKVKKEKIKGGKNG